MALGEDVKLAKTRIAGDLRLLIAQGGTHRVIVDFNANFPGGEIAARALFLEAILGPDQARDLEGRSFVLETLVGDAEVIGEVHPVDPDRIEMFNSLLTDRYLFLELEATQIEEIAGVQARVSRLDPISGRPTEVRDDLPLVHRIWLDAQLQPLVYVSARTIKCDAARAAFNSAGSGIVWAVADTGVARHPHFRFHNSLDLPRGLRHWDFTRGYGDDAIKAEAGALSDTVGHGTHVAGIIAGLTTMRRRYPDNSRVGKMTVAHLDGSGTTFEEDKSPEILEIAGVAPQCKIMSLKVLGESGDGQMSRLIAAINYIQLLNGHGRHVKVHGLNISLGYPFDITAYGAGQSPLCAEVNRLVKCGVVVVVAAGNSGSGQVAVQGGGSVLAAHASTIADPGNADLAITVGSTHRERPHTFGVSFFSAKGPTADGRMKPDLVAPGELIVSCAKWDDGTSDETQGVPFREDNGTSMAAPHVSGAVAAFLSVRREFRGSPEQVKKLFVQNATDLGRRREYQGAGIVDLMRTLQAV